MRRIHRIAPSLLAATALAVSALAACGGSTSPSDDPAPGASLARDDGAPFQTDSLAYTLRPGTVGYEGEVALTFTNRSASTAYIVNCNGLTGVTFEKLVDGRWEAVWGPAIPDCLSPAIVVPPGGTWRTRVHVFSAFPGSNVEPKFRTPEIAGVYRTVWHYVLRSFQPRLPFGEPFPLEARVSNRFTLAVRPR